MFSFVGKILGFDLLKCVVCYYKLGHDRWCGRIQKFYACSRMFIFLIKQLLKNLLLFHFQYLEGLCVCICFCACFWFCLVFSS